MDTVWVNLTPIILKVALNISVFTLNDLIVELFTLSTQ